MLKIHTLNELRARLAANPNTVLLEALPEQYYQDWHLPGALHMPHDAVDALAPTLIPDKTTEIVVYCASNTCQNSHIAAKILTQRGYVNVAVGSRNGRMRGCPRNGADCRYSCPVGCAVESVRTAHPTGLPQ